MYRSYEKIKLHYEKVIALKSLEGRTAIANIDHDPFYFLFFYYFYFCLFILYFFFLIETQEIFVKLSNYQFYIIVAIIDIRKIYFNHAFT